MYHLNSILNKVISEVKVIIIDPPTKIIDFPDGKNLEKYGFDENYFINSIRAEESRIIIEISENRKMNDTSWAVEEAISFF